MSNISRRDFLKTAGVMTLAVAAAGVLAGCDNNTPVVPDVTATSVTANDYTLSIKDVKYVQYQKYAAGALTEETRYVIALLNMKAQKPAECKNTDAPFVVVNKPSKNLVAAASATAADVKAICKLGVAPTALDKDIKGYDAFTAESVNHFVVYEVKGTKVTAADNTVSFTFETPTLSFWVNDAEGHTYTELKATIPALTDLSNSGLDITT